MLPALAKHKYTTFNTYQLYATGFPNFVVQLQAYTGKVGLTYFLCEFLYCLQFPKLSWLTGLREPWLKMQHRSILYERITVYSVNNGLINLNMWNIPNVSELFSSHTFWYLLYKALPIFLYCQKLFCGLLLSNVVCKLSRMGLEWI